MKTLIILAVCLSPIIAAPYQIANALDEKNVDVLHMAAEKGDHQTVNDLIKNGVSVHGISEDGGTSLHKAAEKGREKVAKVLLDNGADVNSQDFAGLTPIHRSVAKGHVNMVNLLIDNNANVNIASNDGSTPLHTAFVKDKMKIAKTLIQNGADLTVPNGKGDSVAGLALNHIVKGVSTIFYGVGEIFHRGLNMLKNPAEAIKKSNLSTVQLNLDSLPTVEMQFGNKKDVDPNDRNSRSESGDNIVPRPTLRFNFSR